MNTNNTSTVSEQIFEYDQELMDHPIWEKEVQELLKRYNCDFLKNLCTKLGDDHWELQALVNVGKQLV
jgi:hypothetical protein